MTWQPVRIALFLLAGAVLSACQTMPHSEASVPLPLSDAEYARITQLPLEPITAGNGAAGPILANESNGAQVFARLQAGFKTPVCTDGERSSSWRKRYAGNPRVFAEHLQQILPMLDFVSKEVETSGLPTEFALIPLVESWYRPDAIGSGGPAGMWQIIATTARNHGIRIEKGYDGRLSPIESTRAALSYLKTLHDMFNDWQATVMAYNAGEYRLIHAFERDGQRAVSGELRQPHGLSNITYDYVAKLQALSCLITEPQRQNLQLPVNSRFQVLTPVLVDENVRALDQVAVQNGVNTVSLRALNPGYRSGRVVAGVPRMVLMPAHADPTSKPLDSVQQVARAEPTPAANEPIVIKTETIPTVAAVENGSAPAPTNHQVRNGDTLWSIAKRYGLSIEALRRMNGLSKSARLRPGQSLKLSP